MKRNVIIGLMIGIGLLLTLEVYAQGYVFGPNVRVSDYPPGSAYARTPNAGQRGAAVREDTVYCVWADDRINYGVWFAKSTDDGQTFLQNVQVDDGLGYAYTPTLAVGDDGTIYVSWDGEPSPFNYKQVFFSKSTDGGLTFTPDVLVNDTAGGIKNHPHRFPSMAVDSAGIIYIAFDDARIGDYDIYFSKSTDGGETFLQNILVNDTISGETLDDTRPALALSKDGDIYVSWSKQFKWLYVCKSTDGGISFGSDVQVNDTVAESWQNSIDVDSRGYVHVLWRDGRDGNANIYYSRSTDGGMTFSLNIRVNDSIHEPEPQAYPSMCVDDSGIVYAVWEDGPASYSDIFFTLSADTGDSVFVEPNVEVDDSDSLCDYPSIAVGDSGKIYVMWSDFRNGFFTNDVYFSVGRYDAGFVEEITNVKKRGVNISTPSPSPFSTRTEIRIQISDVRNQKSNIQDRKFEVSLKILDVTGRQIRMLMTGDVCSGTCIVVWNGRDDSGKKVSPGIYFIRGLVNKEEVNEKVIYIR